MLDGVDETDNVVSERLLPAEIRLDASGRKFLNDNNINHQKDPNWSKGNAKKVDTMDIKKFKSNKKNGFIEKHKSQEQGVAAIAYELPLPNKNFKQGGDFLRKRPLVSN